MNILLTGTSGFIGKNFLQQIKINHWFPKSTIYLLSSKPNDEPGFENIQYKSFLFPSDIFPEIEFDLVIHMGAFTPKSASEANDPEKSTSNIYFTNSLLTALRNRCKKIIFLSTLDVYSAQEEIITEESSIAPISLYAHSKYYCEKLIEAWANTEDCAFQILRIGHVYGPGEEAYKKIIPLSIENIINGQPPEIYSDGTEKRSFLYIVDCAKMIYKASQMELNPGMINIASANSITIRDLVYTIVELLDSSLEVKIQNQVTNGRSLTFDTKKLSKYIGNNETTLRNGLIEEMEYLKTKILNGKLH